VKHVFAWLAWWIALFWLWFLLVGEWNRQELAAGAISATIAASLAEYARVRTAFRARVPLRALADLPQALGMVTVDFGILAWALVASVARRRVVRGRLVSREFEGGAAAVEGVGTRAWAVLLASYSPNAYPIDVDPETRTVFLHDLIPNRRSESPA
jgi:multisubunit Na+/H+ antiporter MnhE subunit